MGRLKNGRRGVRELRGETRAIRVPALLGVQVSTTGVKLAWARRLSPRSSLSRSHQLAGSLPKGTWSSIAPPA